MPVHLYGQCADMDSFGRIGDEFKVAIIEDAAQAFGATWRRSRAGSLGAAAAFSFYPTKSLSAYGDAGCVTTSNPEIAERARVLRVHGSRQSYHHQEIGWNSRLDAIQAAILRVKLKYLEPWNEQRRHCAALYDRLFADAGLISAPAAPPIGLLETQPQAHHIFHQYVVRARRRDQLRAFLEARGIGTEIYYPIPLHLQACFTYLGYAEGDLPQAERAAKEVLALPMFAELRSDEQQYVVTAIADFYS